MQRSTAGFVVVVVPGTDVVVDEVLVEVVLVGGVDVEVLVEVEVEVVGGVVDVLVDVDVVVDVLLVDVVTLDGSRQGVVSVVKKVRWWHAARISNTWSEKAWITQVDVTQLTT